MNRLFITYSLAMALLTTLIPVSSADGINEVIVLANKREQLISDIPMSLAVIQGDLLARTAVENIQDIEKLTSGVRIRDVGNDPKIIIRGAGSAGTYKHDPAVPIYVDGLYRPLLSQGIASFLDVERLEILRGPQGTMFGRNALGGAVSVITNRPSLDSFSGSIEATLGSYDLAKGMAVLNVPLTDSFALRFAGSTTHHDAYLPNTYDSAGGMVDADNELFRLSARLLFGGHSDLTITGSAWNDRANGAGEFGYKVIGIPVNPTTRQTNGFSGILDPRGGLRDGWQGGRDVMGTYPIDPSAAVISDMRQVSTDYLPNRRIKEDTISLTYSYESDIGEFRINAGNFNYSSYNILDADFSIAGTYIISGRETGLGWISGQTRDSQSNQIDANFSKDFDSFQVTAGVFYFDQEQSYNWIFGTTSDTAPQSVNWATWPNDSFEFTAESAAIYAESVFVLTDRLEVTVGGRYSEDKRSSLRLVVDPTTAEGTPRPSHVPSNDSIQLGDDSHFDYRASIMYDIADDTSIFASFSTGYMSGEVQSGTGSLLDASENDSIEVGVKSSLLKNSLSVSLTAYESRYENLTTSLLFLIPESDVYGSRSVPGGGVKSRGLEIESSWQPSENTMLGASVTIDDSEFEEFYKRYVYTETDGNARITTLEDGSKTMDVSGLETPFAPDLTVALKASHKMNLGEYGTITPSAVVYWSESYNTETVPYFWSNQSNFWTLDLGLGYSMARGGLSFQAYVTNATDEEYFTGSDTFSKERAVVQLNDPRTWGIRIKLDF